MRTYVLPFLVLLGVCNSAYGLDPRTHVWVAQQVLNDVIPDGEVTIDGKTYVVDPMVVAALRRHPQTFRMGSIGPDAHPDLVVGQSFLHPGTDGGWGADEWAKWIQDNARKSGDLEAIAYSAGYWNHLAGDVVMHTYVNTYAGDYFVLFDEVEVELRHFVLEHYIGDRTPPLVNHDDLPVDLFDLKPPSGFIANTLILNDSAARAYLKSPAAATHLLAMYRLHKTVHDLRVTIEEFESPLKSRLGELDQLQTKTHEQLEENAATAAKLLLTVEPLIKQIEILEKAVQEQRRLNEPVEAAASQLEQELLKATDAVDSATKRIRNLERELSSVVNRQIAQTEGAIGKFEKAIESWNEEAREQRKNIAKLSEIRDNAENEVNRLADKLDGILRRLPGYKKVKDALNSAKSKLDGAKKELANAEENLRTALDNAAAEAEKLDEARKRLQSLVQRKASIGNLLSEFGKAREAAIAGASRARDAVGQLSEQLQAARDALAERIKPFEEATRALDEVKDQLRDLEDAKNKLVDDIKSLGKELRLLANLQEGLFLDPTGAIVSVLRKWEEDIEAGTKAYVDAATKSLLETMKQDGEPLKPIQEWFLCWAPVFTGIPSEIPSAACDAVAYARELSDKAKKLAEEFASQIPIVRELLAKYERFKAELTAALVENAIELSDRIFGEAFTKFYLVHSKHWSDDDLTKTFSSDTSGKQLLLIPDIVVRVRKDMGRLGTTEFFDPTAFAVAKHAVTLAKLTLLDVGEFDRMATNYGITEKSLYAFESDEEDRAIHLYPNKDLFHNILYRGVRSIDGNQQWRGVGLPYLRRDGKFENTKRNDFGYCKSDDPAQEESHFGFRLWVDEQYRTKVFAELFPGELKMASLCPGLADLIPEGLQKCEDKLGQCAVCGDGDVSFGSPRSGRVPQLRTAEERKELELERRIQVEEVPFVTLIDRVDGRDRQQVEQALREQIRSELAGEIREEILQELRNSQKWGTRYDQAYHAAKAASKPLLLVVEGKSDTEAFGFDKSISDELQAKLLGAFVLCKLKIDAADAQRLLGRRASGFPVALLIDCNRGCITREWRGILSHLNWAEVLVQASQSAQGLNRRR